MGVRALGLAAATTLAMLFPTPALAQQQFIKDKVSTIIKKVGIHLGSNFADPLNTKELQAGWSINSLKPHGDPASAFNSVPAQIAMDVANSFSLRPQVKIEYFVTPKFTVRSALNYVLTNPRVMIGTPSGVLTDTWNASNVSLAVGVGYYPFRK